MFNPLRALPLRFGSPKPPLPLRATAFYSMNSDCLGPLAAPALRFRFRLSSQLALRFSLVSLYRFQGSPLPLRPGFQPPPSRQLD